MIDLRFEVIGPSLGDQDRLSLRVALAGNDRIDIGLVVARAIRCNRRCPEAAPISPSGR